MGVEVGSRSDACKEADGVLLDWKVEVEHE